MNLGSPDSTSVKDLRQYLKEFLMDERVIDMSLIARTLLVRGIIVPFRSPKSAEAYKKIWWEEGSPLIVLTEQLQRALQKNFAEHIEISMRYRNPTAEYAYKNLIKKNPDLEEVILVPLYPHYAMSSYETAVEHMKTVHARNKYAFSLKTVPPFYDHPAYIKALAESIRPQLEKGFDQLLFSYHGIPERHVFKTDKSGGRHDLHSTEKCCDTKASQSTCYRHQVMVTAKLVAAQLSLDKHKWAISYQSRLGRDPWLTPSTQERLPKLPTEGVKNIVVVCPSFVSDCLETLEEINMSGRKDFLQNGGENFNYVSCLNIQPVWVEALTQIIKETMN